MDVSGARRRAWGDLGLAVAVVAVGLVEIWAPLGSVMGSGSPVSSSVGVLATGVAVSQRRRWPLGALAAVLAVWVALYVLDPPYVLFFGTLVPLMVLAFTVARHSDRTRSLVGLGLLVVFLLAADLRVAELREASEVLFHWTVVVGAWGLGLAFRTRELHTVRAEQRARAAEVEAAEATARERARIARELHDVVAHSVSVMVVQAGAAQQALDDVDEVRSALNAIRTTGTEALGELRRMLGVLRLDDGQASLTPQPGLSSLPTLLDQARESGIEVIVKHDGEPRPLPAGLDLAVYRIVQESLTNVRRHSGATRADVAFTWAPDRVEVEVGDDGRGARADAAGHGITGMRERAALYGGQLRTSTKPGAGFQVHVLLPVAAP